MKYALFLLLACAPLVALTVMTVVELLPQDAETGADNPATAAAAKLAAEATTDAPLEKARLDRDRVFLKTLAESRLLDAPSVLLTDGESTVSPASAELQTVEQRWRVSEEVRRLIVSYLNIRPREVNAKAPVQQQLDEANAAYADLEQFCGVADEKSAAVAAAEPLLSAAAAQLKTIDEHRKNLELLHSGNQDLARAKEDFAAARYDRCLGLLNAIPVDRLLDPQIRTAVAELQDRAKYRLAFSKIRQDSPSSIEQFFQQYPAATAGEEILHSQLQAALDKLIMLAEIDNLFRATEIDVLLSGAMTVRSKDPGGAYRLTIRRGVRAWLEERIPALAAPTELRGKEEAVLKAADERLLGIFWLPTDATLWRYWRDREARENTKQLFGERQIGEDSFAVKPHMPPRYVQWADEYNDRRSNVLQSDRIEDWNAFADWCDQARKALNTYQNKYGTTTGPDFACRTWQQDLQKAINQSKGIVARWEQFCEVLFK